MEEQKNRREMETQQPWRSLRFSFRSATIIVCFLNLIAALLLLQGFLSSASTRKFSTPRPDTVQLNYIKESEEMRRAMEPLELIKRVREITQEAYVEAEIVQPKDTKQTAAEDLSKRLKDSRSFSDAASQKALEEWRKRKMERARQRQLEKN
ncbi:hypothetical protein AAG906_016888 [Vitis piasezkii]|uniref:Transmembrane protein n=1 Tax=Vitis vinifera TaxID=29760 RepID=A5BSY7_VITVI|nr:hypothetical protein VITISV_004291 [Vitis vinifera]